MVTKTAARALIVLTSHGQLGNTGRKTGFYLSEVSHPYKVFTDAGLEVDFASPKGGAAPMDGVDRNDPTNAAFLDGDALKRTQTTLKTSAVDPSRYQAVFLAGGHGTMWDLRADAGLQSLTAKIYDAGGVVGAVCHGPAGLVDVKLSDGSYLVAGKTVTSFTNEEEDAVELTAVVPFLLETALTAHGAKFVGAPKFKAHVVVSDRLVTGQNPASAAGVAEAIVKALPKR